MSFFVQAIIKNATFKKMEAEMSNFFIINFCFKVLKKSKLFDTAVCFQGLKPFTDAEKIVRRYTMVFFGSIYWGSAGYSKKGLNTTVIKQSLTV